MASGKKVKPQVASVPAVLEPIAIDTPLIAKNPSAGFPIVGIGASAGGLAAFEA